VKTNEMESSLKDRIVLVTGGAAGIGRAVALLAAERGASVAVLDRDAQGALAVGTQVVEINHGKALALNVDVSNEAAVARRSAKSRSSSAFRRRCLPGRESIAAARRTSCRRRPGAE
jgi:NADP-dependent 3-hydroxy acid dehydrogenase YdfG